MRPLIFVGPSFPALRVQEFVPDAEVRPPIRRGDLDAVAAGAVVAILDGVSGAELGVTAKEIAQAIARGARVVGGAGIGALRAVEVPGMIGVGHIHEMYKGGLLDRDDEVAVVVDEDSGRAVTEPLVNVRFAVEAMVTSASLERRVGDAIVSAAEKLHFADRTYARILREAGIAGDPQIEVLAAALQSIDLRREDAQTVLESLPRLAREESDGGRGVTPVGPAADPDDADPLPVAETGSGDSPLVIWEYGERLRFRDLVRFMAVTGRLERGARESLEVGDDGAGAATLAGVPSVQDLFAGVMAEWGWTSPEDVHITLNDLGIGFSELQGSLRRERRIRAAIRSAVHGGDDRALQALRVGLLVQNLSLKREAMRLSAVVALADVDPGAPEPSSEEIDDAISALRCARPDVTWEELLAEGGLSPDDARPLVALLARARRVGVPLQTQMLQAERAPGRPGNGLEELPASPKGTGAAGRSTPDDVAEEIARRLAGVIGVTRIAQLGELERFGMHVSAVYRPSIWSASFGSGKAETREAAVIGGVMEELERYCQEQFAPPPARTESLDSIRARGEPAVDPRTMALPFDSGFAPGSELAWISANDLVTGEKVLVPRAVALMERERNDILFSPRSARKIFSTNGLASGFTLTEALVHGLCELIERHSNKLSEQAIGNPGPTDSWPDYTFVDLATCPGSTARIVERIRGAGYALRVLDTTCEVTVPTFVVRITRPDAPEAGYSPGACAHPDPEVALNRALLEAVQSRVAAAAGNYENSGMKVRSLGRHWRPRPSSRGEAYWIRPHVPRKPFDAVRGYRGRSAKDDLDFVVRRLTAAGFERVLWCDLSRDELSPAKVVRAFIPGVEEINPLHTGLRARVSIVSELMHRHEW
jgi:ribosomal protein S12 methylthiotransferase accessory factor